MRFRLEKILQHDVDQQQHGEASTNTEQKLGPWINQNSLAALGLQASSRRFQATFRQLSPNPCALADQK